MKLPFREPLLEKHKEFLNEDNRKVSEIFELLILFCTAALPLIGIFREEYSQMNTVCMIYACISLLLYLFTRFFVRKHPKYTPVSIMCVMLTAYSYSVFSGIIYNIHAPSITVYALMIAAFSAYMVSFYYIVLIQLITGFTYCCLALALKPEYGIQDTINYVIFFIMAFLLAHIVYKSRLAHLISLDEAVEREKSTERLLNDIPGGVGIFDVSEKATCMRYLNDAYYRMVEESREERLKRINNDFINGVDKRDRALIANAIRSVLSGENSVDFSYRVIKKGGDILWLRLEGNVVSRNDGKIVVYCSFSNVTQINSRLDSQLRQISAALDTAEKASEEKSEFYSRMSHDMRTPMNGVLGMAELSKGENDVEVLHHNIDMIEASGKYMLSLINDSLDMQRIEMGKLVLMPNVTLASAFIESIRVMIAPTAAQKNIKFSIDDKISCDGYIRIDTVRFKQILMNLLSNAVKFTPEGGQVKVEIERIKHEKYSDTDVFRISDTGVGMSREFMDNNMFSAYSQEKNEMTSRYAGSGLGLAITKSLVEAMGGKIEVESKLGKGTTFTITLDIELVDSADVEASNLTEKKMQENKPDVLSGKRILVCEDHPLNAEIAVRLLSRKGIEAVHAENGCEGVEMFEKSEAGFFDAVLMDIRMPVMDGLEAAAKIRSLDRPDAALVPIIAMTANAYDNDVHNSLKAGMNIHLSKPIDPTKLYSTLEKLISEYKKPRRPEILVVDDIEINRAVIIKNLGSDYNVTEASDGETALKIMENQKIDVVVTDISMPGMDGLMLIKKIRENKEFKDVLIIANTQLGEPTQEDKLIAAGANDFLFKPNSPKVLLLRMKNLLSGKTFTE